MSNFRRSAIWLVGTAFFLVAASPQALSVVFDPPGPTAYFWRGVDGSGNGSGTDWQNSWTGPFVRHVTHPGSPPTMEVLPPKNGDFLYFHDGFVTEEGPYSVFVGGHSLPDSPVYFALAATFSGGSLDVGSIGITNHTYDEGDIVFVGTAMSAQHIGASVGKHSITFSGATLESKSIGLVGGTFVTSPLPTINFDSAFVNAAGGTLEITGGNANAPWLLNMTQSLALADTINIGSTHGGETSIRFKGDTASFIGAGVTNVAPHVDSIVRISVRDNAPQFTPSSVVNIGEHGKAFVTIDNDGKLNTATTLLALHETSSAEVNLDFGNWITKDVFMGGLGSATVTADFESIMASENVVLAALASAHSTLVTLKNDSSWNISGYLYVGREGVGQLDIENASFVEVTQEIVLGVEEDTSSGLVNVTGADSLLTTNATFEVGRRSTGTLNVKEGAQVESESHFIVGSYQGGVGEVVVDGTNSRISVQGMLAIGFGDAAPFDEGDNGIGTVTVRNGGTLYAGQNAVLGWNRGSRGVLSIVGANSKLELEESATLTIGRDGSGELNLSEGATFKSLGEVKLGEREGSRGKVTVSGSGSLWEVEGDLNVGNGDGEGEAHGEVTIEAGGELKLSSDSIVRVGRLEYSEGTLQLRGANSKVTGGTGGFQPFEVGSAGKGTLRVEDGFKLDLSGKNMTLGAEDTGDGSVHLTGGGSEMTLAELTIGNSGKGLIEITDHGKLTVTGPTIQIGIEEDSEGTLRIHGNESQLVFGGQFVLAERGKGTIDLQHGAHLTTETLALGKLAGSEGTLTLSDSLGGLFGSGTTWFVTTGELIVGDEGKGILDISEGSRVDVGGKATLAKQADSNAEVYLTGAASLWHVEGDLSVASHGSASVHLQQGRINVKANVIIGETQNAHGTVIVEDTQASTSRGLHIGEQLIVGKAGHGMLNVTDGGMVNLAESFGFDGIVTLGQMEESNGLITVEGNHSELRAQTMIVGDQGTGDLTILNKGKVLVTGDLTLGKQNNSQGTISVSGEESRLEVVGTTKVGEDSAGTLTIDNKATANLGPSLQIGAPAGQGVALASRVNVHSEATLEVNSLSIGPLAMLDISNATVDVASVTMEGTSGIPAKLSIASDGKLKVSSITAHNAQITLESGGAIEGSSSMLINGGSGGSSTVTITGAGSAIKNLPNLQLGTTGVAVMTLEDKGSVDLTSLGEFVVGDYGRLEVGDEALVETRRLVVQGRVRMSGIGSFINASNQIVVQGFINIHGVSNGIQASQISVLPGGRIQAASIANQVSGTIRGNVTNNGTMIIGQSPGRLLIEGDYLQESDGTLELEIGGLAAGTEYDFLEVTGNATIEGDVFLKFIDGFAPSTGDAFSFISAGSLDIASNIHVRNLAPGWQYDVTQQGSTWTVTSLSDGVFLSPSGDYNDDGVVNAADYVMWRDHLGSATSLPNDETPGVDMDDYAVWQANFGADLGGGASSTTAAVPEPSTILLFLGALSFACAIRKKPG